MTFWFVSIFVLCLLSTAFGFKACSRKVLLHKVLLYWDLEESYTFEDNLLKKKNPHKPNENKITFPAPPPSPILF